MVFEDKIAVLLHADLEPWRAINVTAFIAAGLAAHRPDLIGENYIDGEARVHAALFAQPVIVLAGDGALLAAAHRRAVNRDVRAAAFTQAMFATGHDAANRAVFREHPIDHASLVGLGIVAERRAVDKIVKGAKMYA